MYMCLYLITDAFVQGPTINPFAVLGPPGHHGHPGHPGHLGHQGLSGHRGPALMPLPIIPAAGGPLFLPVVAQFISLRIVTITHISGCLISFILASVFILLLFKILQSYIVHLIDFEVFLICRARHMAVVVVVEAAAVVVVEAAAVAEEASTATIAVCALPLLLFQSIMYKSSTVSCYLLLFIYLL
jgi:hypothetical protein